MRQGDQKSENKMGVMPINKLLITMSVPMILSMLVQALYNVVDSIFVAQINESALTAVSLSFPIQSLMIAIGAGTGVGINALLSKSLGEKDQKKANKAANNGVFLGILSVIIFIIFGLFGARFFFESQIDIPEIIAYGQQYLSIISIFSFGLFGQLTFERLLQSTGKTIYTMFTQSLGAIINIILDPILIFGLLGFPQMGVAGAAIATVVGQCTAMLLAIYFNLTKNHEIKLSIKEFKPDWKIIKVIYSVGFPSILMMAIGSIMNYGLNSILMGFTATAAAVFGVYFKLQSFVFMPVIGLNNGMVPIIAYNYGARNKDRVTKTIKWSIFYAVTIMLIGLAIFQLMPEKLLLMFNASDDMLAIGIPALRTISFSFLFAGFCIVMISSFQALGNGLLSLIISVVRQLVVLLPVAYLLSLSGSLDAVWWSFPIAELAAFILSALFMKYLLNKETAKFKEAKK
ncbi:MATE family efflux transporter [Acetobacterium woodii]|uniref:Probable multidrug resistance protein NorM n=1 Tax=Acetobacterium woodii (strain ATCC 29683 / DSM 1030 / JCM 2381 / KCTC 1655 / WB1) TaxID=931626 RepID=H6LIE8_ACEWD|nr:MATE family efflux transporter [Acetobacterium woodii]AFA47322.1 multi antimicrobial extrusion protein MatE2 [Acetobacterium woodii DSM 1030]